jgi:type III secretory pathway component EscT
MCGSAAKTALLRPISTIGIFPVLEVEADLIKAFLRNKIILLTEITTIYDRIDKLSWI